MEQYDYYNREERAICAHLFRLLHEKLDIDSQSPFLDFIDILSNSRLKFEKGESSLKNLKHTNKTIFCEASIIRDKYQNEKPNIENFMDSLTCIVIEQEKVDNCRVYSELPKPLNEISKTHPKQIRFKAETKNIQLNPNEYKVYGVIQGMFNAKPDLVLTIDNVLLVCEAKFTEKFDKQQLDRTWNIAEIWAKLLYKDLGFNEPPIYSVFKLGAEKYNPDISWKQIMAIADKFYPKNDRTRIAINSGVDLLKRYNLE